MYSPQLHAGVVTAELTSSELRPEQVLGEIPSTRGTTLAVSRDGNLAVCLWACTVGGFRWEYHCDEIVHILEGRATITVDGHAPRVVTAGDVLYFEPGLVANWEVTADIKKLAICRTHAPSLRERVTAKLRKVVRGIVTGRRPAMLVRER
jgi:uncharacterized cupin superfamily protein